MTTTTTTTLTTYLPGDRIRYGCNLHNSGTFVRYMDETPASVIAGRIVLLTSDHWGQGDREGSAWEKDTAPGRLGDVGSHHDRSTGRYVAQSWAR